MVRRIDLCKKPRSDGVCRDILGFFRGGLYGEDAHDDLAKSIAVAGQQWAAEHFRYVDMQAYMYRSVLSPLALEIEAHAPCRLLIEYVRLYAEDREAQTFHGDTSIEPSFD